MRDTVNKLLDEVNKQLRNMPLQLRWAAPLQPEVSSDLRLGMPCAAAASTWLNCQLDPPYI